MAKVVWTEKLNRHQNHILEVSRELSPEEASLILSWALSQAVHHWEGGDPKITLIIQEDVKRLEGRIRAQVLVNK